MARSDDPAGAGDYLPLVYDRLRRLAQSYMKDRPPAVSFQPTALVHEAYLKLAQGNKRWRCKTHFFAVAATQMRHVLVDRARAAEAAKRSGARVTLDDRHGLVESHPLDVLAVDQALSLLAQRSPRQERIVEMRLFSGMTVPEIVEILGVSERTVKYEWRHARAWLARQLRNETGAAPDC